MITTIIFTITVTTASEITEHILVDTSFYTHHTDIYTFLEFIKTKQIRTINNKIVLTEENINKFQSNCDY